jgi:hypothetical protein
MSKGLIIQAWQVEMQQIYQKLEEGECGGWQKASEFWSNQVARMKKSLKASWTAAESETWPFLSLPFHNWHLGPGFLGLPLPIPKLAHVSTSPLSGRKVDRQKLWGTSMELKLKGLNT